MSQEERGLGAHGDAKTGLGRESIGVRRWFSLLPLAMGLGGLLGVDRRWSERRKRRLYRRWGLTQN
jgi:hypothetical protein